MTNRETGDYPRYNLRSRAVSEVDVVPRSESKDNNNKACPFGERASGDNDNRRAYDPEQVTRSRLNLYCSSHSNSDDRKSDSGTNEPHILRHPDNFTPANPLVTQVHIQLE